MIREAISSDIPTFVALQRRIEQEDEIWGYVADSETAWSQRSLAWSFAAVSDDGATIGFIYCVPRPYAGERVFAPDNRILEIVELVVAAEHRDRGIGRRLVAIARDRAKQNGFTHLHVHSASKRFDEVLRFYRDCGFAPWFMELTQPVG